MKKEYEVTITATIIVEADDEDDARAVVLELAEDGDLEWNSDEFKITDVKEAKE